MTLIEIAKENLATAIAKAKTADDAFGAALKVAGYKSRWEWSALIDERPKWAYLAKVHADEAMHEAFEKVRVLERMTD